MIHLKKRDRGAISVAYARRKEKAYKYFTAAGVIVGLLSIVLIVTANQMSTNIVQDADSIRPIFIAGIVFAPISFFIYVFALITSLSAGIRNWNLVLGFLSSFQAVISLIFARDILLLDSSLKLSLQTPNWSSYILWSILVASLLLTFFVGVFSRKSV
ncbi:MAG: hypothetical protein AB7T02_07025 [Mesotoga sp.]|uniref:hypothetical protein n=1 Tax=Mesotoga TaxID=1184396 RepID=UPI000EF13477|nr:MULTISPECIES: hypothetical protein [Mesotoga]MDK2945104.1 hypothetical protein [Mesotoga sp.]HNQ71461.1 hypothetical protein [Mesotoga prima]HNS76550.1 hypothetical protein [Mesotoga prima]HPJ33017.1 hypothetical protein [Mesotoga prima]HQC13655.1 hypothetical protein [Mesotoga prima]